MATIKISTPEYDFELENSDLIPATQEQLEEIVYKALRGSEKKTSKEVMADIVPKINKELDRLFAEAGAYVRALKPEKGEQGDPGKDGVVTEQHKLEIALSVESQLGPHLQSYADERIEAHQEAHMAVHETLEGELAELERQIGGIEIPEPLSGDEIVEKLELQEYEKRLSYSALKDTPTIPDHRKYMTPNTNRLRDQVDFNPEGSTGEVVTLQGDGTFALEPTASPINDTDDLAEGATNLYNRLPTGGATDQKLVKSSNTNYDAEWVDDAPGIQTDTRDNILAIATPTAGETWYATDIKRFYLYTGAGWVSSGTPFFNDEVNTTNPDTAPIESRVSGFTEEGIYNKVLSYCGAKGLILSKDRVDTDGAMGRSEEGRPVIFFDGEHQEFLIGVRIQRDGTEGGLPELRVIKGGNVEWVDLHNGDSDSLDLNGLPLVHGWMEDMGVEAHHTIIDPN